MSSHVAVRRKRDGLYLVQREGRLGWSTSPAAVKSEAKAITIIRVDIGDDLEDYDILPGDGLDAATRIGA